MQKPVIGVSRAPAAQTLPQGYSEHVFFSCQGLGRQINPVIRLAWTPPTELGPGTPVQADAGQAQAGFECLSLLLQGQLHTRDSSGQAHTLQAGDALWASAGQGVLRQQGIGPDLAREGGTLERLELWINMPAAAKASAPHTQLLRQGSMPSIALPNEAGELRLIAGEWAGELGPAETLTPLQVWTLRVKAERSAALSLPPRWYGALLLMQGAARINHWPHIVTGGHLAVLGAAGQDVHIAAEQDTHLLLASGEPLDEPIASHEALVMNSAEQLQAAQQALAAGAFGQL